MTIPLPEGAPATLGEAFAYINSVTAPSLDDLKIMVLLEAAGLDLYKSTAAGTDDPAVLAILEHNGREEMAHAHRVSKAIKAISGEDFPPPEASANPYLDGPMLEFAVTPCGDWPRPKWPESSSTKAGPPTPTTRKLPACSVSTAAKSAITATG